MPGRLLAQATPRAEPGGPRSSVHRPIPTGNPSLARVDAIMDDVTETLWRLSGTYFHLGFATQTLRLLRVIEELDPLFADAYADAAWLEWSSGDNAASLADLKRGLAANPGGYQLYSEIGNYYRIYLHQPARAYPYYLQASDHFDDTPWYDYGSLAHTAEDVGDLVRAEIAWKTAILKAGADPVRRGVSQHNLDRVERKIAARLSESAQAYQPE